MFRALSLHLCLFSDAGSLALAIDGAARCLATSDPAVVSVQCQLLSGVKSQSVESSVQEAYTPLKTSPAGYIWSGFLYRCFPLFNPHYYCFQTWNSYTSASGFLMRENRMT